MREGFIMGLNLANTRTAVAEALAIILGIPALYKLLASYIWTTDNDDSPLPNTNKGHLDSNYLYAKVDENTSTRSVTTLFKKGENWQGVTISYKGIVEDLDLLGTQKLLNSETDHPEL